MKKLLLIATAFMMSMTLNAAEQQSDSLVIHFDFTIIDPSTGHNGNHKSPVSQPNVAFDEASRTVIFTTPCPDATLQVVNTLGVAVYTEELYETTTEVELPETLVGEYELQILRGNICFYATIEL